MGIATVQCSCCRRPLRFTGSMIDDILASGGSVTSFNKVDLTGYQQWLGTICTNCSMIFCEECQECGWASPCRNCGQPVKPALASYLPSKQNFLQIDIPSLSRESLPGGQLERDTHLPVKKHNSKRWWEFWKK